MANYARPVYRIEEGERDAGKERMRRSKKFQEAGRTVKISTTSTYLRGHGPPWSLESWSRKKARKVDTREISFQRISRRGGGRKERRVVAAGGPRPVETVNGAPA